MASSDYSSQASDEPLYEVDSFELLWERHKGAIIFGVAAVVAIIAGVFIWLYTSSSSKAAAAAAFGEASTPGQWTEIISKYPKSPVAGNAAILLAQTQRDAGKIDEANATLNAFISAQPKSQFAPLAALALAENQALAGKLAEAETSLQAISDNDAKSFVAPFALMLKAELQVAQWDRDGALRSYELLYQNFGDTVSGDSSQQAYEALRALARPAAVAKEPGESAPASEESAGSESAPAPAAE